MSRKTDPSAFACGVLQRGWKLMCLLFFIKPTFITPIPHSPWTTKTFFFIISPNDKAFLETGIQSSPHHRVCFSNYALCLGMPQPSQKHNLGPRQISSTWKTRGQWIRSQIPTEHIWASPACSPKPSEVFYLYFHHCSVPDTSHLFRAHFSPESSFSCGEGGIFPIVYIYTCQTSKK